MPQIVRGHLCGAFFLSSLAANVASFSRLIERRFLSSPRDLWEEENVNVFPFFQHIGDRATTIKQERKKWKAIGNFSFTFSSSSNRFRQRVSKTC